MVNLLLERWCEPSGTGRLHLSTLVQQVLSLIAQFGGVTARRAWSILSEVFDSDQSMFMQVLRSLGAWQIIRQEPDGTLLLDEAGERIVNHLMNAEYASRKLDVNGTRALVQALVSALSRQSRNVLF